MQTSGDPVILSVAQDLITKAVDIDIRKLDIVDTVWTWYFAGTGVIFLASFLFFTVAVYRMTARVRTVETEYRDVRTSIVVDVESAPEKKSTESDTEIVHEKNNRYPSLTKKPVATRIKRITFKESDVHSYIKSFF